MIKAYAISLPGGHAQNEDAFRIERHYAYVECTICFVGDGQGGQAGGGAASQTACRAGMEAALCTRPNKLLHASQWHKILRAVDKLVSNDREAGFTTLVGLGVTHDRICGGSNGDSAAILFNGDGSVANLTERQHKNPPIGSRTAEIVCFEAVPIPPWQLILLTDGVYKFAGWEKIIALAAEYRGRELIHKALEETGRSPEGGLMDDFTMVVLGAS